jgi:hypothetical protein
MADATDSKSAGGDIVRVQVPPSALTACDLRLRKSQAFLYGASMNGHDSVKCEEIQAMIPAFVHGELTDAQMEDFLTHIRDCKNCREELMTYDILTYGLKEEKFSPEVGKSLSRLAGEYNFLGLVNRQIRDMEIELKRKRALERVAFFNTLIVNALMLIGAVLAVLLTW